MTLTLANPLAGDGSSALVLTLATKKATQLRILFDTGEGFGADSFETTVIGHDAMQLVCAELTTRDARPIQRLRLDFILEKSYSSFMVSPLVALGLIPRCFASRDDTDDGLVDFEV